MDLLKKYIYTIILLFFTTFGFCQNYVTHDLKEPLLIKNFNFKITDKTASAFYFEPINANNNTGRIVINLSTLKQDNITLAWQNSITKKTKVQWFARLQYRLNDSDQWQDVKDGSGRKIEFVSTHKRYSRNFSNITLPKECENREFVQISWLIDTYTKNKSGYPDIHFNNINIHSDYDKYSGKQVLLKVFKAADENKETIKDIVFDKMPLPYIYPGSYRISFAGENIRDSITLRIIGADASQFSLSNNSLSEKQMTGLNSVSVNYSPKNEGTHAAELVINTYKLGNPLKITLHGECAKMPEYDKNLLPERFSPSSEVNYHIPVFSNINYQYRLQQEKNTVKTIYIYYKWYRDSQLIEQLQDTVKTEYYSRNIKSPHTSNYLDIELKSQNDIKLKSYYFGLPKAKTMIKSGRWFDKNNWDSKTIPAIDDFVVIDKNITGIVDKDAVCSMLILNDSANLKINAGRTFYVSSDIFYNKNAWISVSQHLLAGRWNYISSPVNHAHAAMFSIKNLSSDNDTWFMQYNTGKLSVHDDFWSEYITDPQFVLTPGKGYAVYTHTDMDVKYEGLLCNSSVTIPLLSSSSDRWNMVGNPYTAPLSSKKLFDDIDGKIQGNVIMLFDKINKVYNPVIIDSKEEVIIPSLESFFVEAMNPPAEITFKRSHQYIPQTSQATWYNNNYLNLSVRKSSGWQYALLGMDDRSDYGFDSYDCHKMYGVNEKMPEIYLTDGKDEYSVNVFPDYPAVYDIGFYVGEATDTELNINNLSVLPDYVMIILENKADKTFIDFCSAGQVDISLKSGTNEDYRLHILKSIDLDNVGEFSGIFLWADNGRLLFYADGNLQVDKIRIQKNDTLISEEFYSAKNVHVKNLAKGIYKVSFLIDGQWSESKDLKI